MRTPAVVVSGLLALPAVYAASATDWQSRTIYQVRIHLSERIYAGVNMSGTL